MRYVSVTVLALTLLPSGIVACASGNDDNLFDAGIGGAGGAGSATAGKAAATGTSTGTGTAASSGASGGGMCVPSCMSDADCQNSCPPAGPNSNCCDTATGICFVSNTPACPPSVPADAGTDSMSPY